jgi:hypothetical protein
VLAITGTITDPGRRRELQNELTPQAGEA